MSIISPVLTMQSSLEEWLHHIEHLNNMSIDLNIDRVLQIAVALDLIHPAKYVILVGGTNGKGTTCCLLETILLHNNNKVGVYMSPHLLKYNERVRVCGRELPDSVHTEAMFIIESVRNSIALTYFEFVTLSALYIFKQSKLDVLILEVGLGGRLDATNIVDADISVITNIAIDHTDFLGVNRDMIAREKSGIFRYNRPAVIGEYNYPVIIDKAAQDCGTFLFSRGRQWDFHVYEKKWLWRGCYDQNNVLYDDLPLPIIPVENAAIAVSVLHCLSITISKVSIYYGLQVAALPGRFQIINYNPLVILDVGHNPHAADYVVKRLKTIFLKKSGSVRIVIGMLKNKDIYGTLNKLKNLVKIWYCSSLNTPLSASALELSDCLINCNVKLFDCILDAWDAAIADATCEDCVLVFGSFHAVSPIMKEIVHNDPIYR